MLYLQCCVFSELSLATTLTVLTPVSCFYMTSFNYGGKEARDVGLTCNCHMSNITPDSIFFDSIGWGMTHFLLLLLFFSGGNCHLPQYRRGGFKWLQRDSNPQPLSSKMNTQPFSQIGQMIELCCEYLSVWCILLYVLIQSYHCNSSGYGETLTYKGLRQMASILVHVWGYQSRDFIEEFFCLSMFSCFKPGMLRF